MCVNTIRTASRVDPLLPIASLFRCAWITFPGPEHTFLDGSASATLAFLLCQTRSPGASSWPDVVLLTELQGAKSVSYGMHDVVLRFLGIKLPPIQETSG